MTVEEIVNVVKELLKDVDYQEYVEIRVRGKRLMVGIYDAESRKFDVKYEKEFIFSDTAREVFWSVLRILRGSIRGISVTVCSLSARLF